MLVHQVPTFQDTMFFLGPIFRNGTNVERAVAFRSAASTVGAQVYVSR